MDLKSRLREIYGSKDDTDELRARLEKLQRREVYSIADHLGGYWKENRAGQLVRVEKDFPCFFCQGDFSFEPLSSLDPESVTLLAGDPRLAGFSADRALFLDTETTGLAGGAGTCPFLVGAGYFRGSDFRLVQFFLPDFESEHAFLTDFADFVTELMGQGVRYLVTYNGKSFDLSLLENRFVLQRLDNPCPALLHLDLLHPCRLLWRGEFGDCSLQTLERHVLNYNRFPDIPSHLIPVAYFNFLHWGEWGSLKQVLEHNGRDIISMAILLGVAGRCVAGSDLSPVADSLCLARFHLRRGRLSEAAGFIEKGLDQPRHLDSRLTLLFQLTRLRRRLGKDDEALALCRELIRDYAQPPLAVFEEAAKILEHRQRNFQEALNLVFQALDLYPGSPELEKRKSRLACRLEGRRWY